MANILIVYSTVDGHTRKICERLREVIISRGHAVTLAELDGTNAPDPGGFDKVVIGASIRYGHHRPAVHDYIRRHRALLESRPSAFFSVNIVARKPGKNTPAGNPYLRKFLRRIDWQPSHLAVFAGMLDYPRYGRLDRLMIRLIMWLTRGPTDPDAVVEFTDWGRVEMFGRELADMES